MSSAKMHEWLSVWRDSAHHAVLRITRTGGDASEELAKRDRYDEALQASYDGRTDRQICAEFPDLARVLPCPKAKGEDR